MLVEHARGHAGLAARAVDAARVRPDATATADHAHVARNVALVRLLVLLVLYLEDEGSLGFL